MEKQEIKYLRELNEFLTAYISEIIDEIYVGVGISLGLPEDHAYKLANTDPKNLQKAGFIKNIFNKFKKIIPFKKKKFRPKKVDISQATPEQWDTFNKGLDNYWKEFADKVTGDVTAKGFFLGRETANFRKKKKPYKNKSLYQVVEDQFSGKMPDSIEQAYKKYDFTNAEKKALNRSLSNVGMYVTEASNNVKEAIRKVVNKGIEEGKTPVEIASDLYWEVEKDPDGMNKYKAENLKRNWGRVAATEIAGVHEAAILAADEADAMESLKDPSKAVYYVRTGGTCKWCRSKQGRIVRLVPSTIASGIEGESLKSIGINDPNTDIAIWPGKNNVGRKQPDWLICCPAHPWNVATFQPIDLKEDWYNPKTGDVEKRQKKQKFVPQLEIEEPPEDFRKPKKIGDNLVRVGYNVYEAVDKSVADKKLDEWRKDRTLPIPVQIGSPDYIRIFERAE